MDASSADFDNLCEEYLSSTDGINIWFDPIDPLTSISQTEICDLHSILFESLESHGITSLAEYVSFSYLVSLDLYLNAYEQEDYESCINSEVLEDPEDYCNDFFDDSDNFNLWSSAEQTTMCEAVDALVTTDCDADEYCDACAILTADIYQTYENFMNDLYSTIFQAYEDDMFDTLEAENKYIQTLLSETSSDTDSSSSSDSD